MLLVGDTVDLTVYGIDASACGVPGRPTV